MSWDPSFYSAGPASGGVGGGYYPPEGGAGGDVASPSYYNGRGRGRGRGSGRRVRGRGRRSVGRGGSVQSSPGRPVGGRSVRANGGARHPQKSVGGSMDPLEFLDVVLYFLGYLETEYTEATRPESAQELREAVSAFRKMYLGPLGPAGVADFDELAFVNTLAQSEHVLRNLNAYVEAYDRPLRRVRYRPDYSATPAQYLMNTSGSAGGAGAGAEGGHAPAAANGGYGAHDEDLAFLCKLCGVRCASQRQLSEHEQGRRHKMKQAMMQLRRNKIQLEKSKGGVTIEPLGSFELTVGQKQIVYIKITNNHPTATRNLIRFGPVKRVRDMRCAQLADPLSLRPSDTFQLTLAQVTGRVIGELRVLVVFVFDTFRIGRYLTFTVHDEADDMDILAPTSEYQKKKVTVRDLDRDDVRAPHMAAPPPGREMEVEDDMRALSFGQVSKDNRGERPPLPTKQKFARKLAAHPIPSWVRSSVSSNDMTAVLNVLDQPLTIRSYKPFMQLLLFVEECQMEVDIRHYDLEGVTLAPKGHYLRLRVPGLAEKRPSVLYGDCLFVKYTGQRRSRRSEFEGFVHNVGLDDVNVRFNPRFHSEYIRGQKVDVRFTFNRTALKRAHRAVIEVDKNRAVYEPFLFPTPNPRPARPVALNEPGIELDPYDRTLNPEQLRAVRSIVRGEHGCAPFLVMGPPGTGKTTVVVEAILQVLAHVPDARLLVCAPSNDAADILVERLGGRMDPLDLGRIHAFKRQRDSVSEKVMQFSPYDENLRVFGPPPMERLKRYRVIVSTLMTGSSLFSLGLEPGHITHFFIDEAGHATEPDAIMPFAGLLTRDSRVILAGDPKQLGPVVRSPVAEAYWLGRSLLERLMDRPLYQRDERRFANDGFYNPVFMVKLVRNYRSHPDILRIPNELFYDSDLIACADEQKTHSLLGWPTLPNKNFPVLFHGVRGKEQREGNSPSWFNASEASAVAQHVRELLKFRRSGLRPHQIGVISPYRKQVDKISRLLNKKGFGDVKTGSIETFQGQERRVIIISPVRSSSAHIDFDQRYNLGFLTNPRRFNVAVTRAKALVIVVGNPFVLETDRYWGRLLRLCLQNGSYMGCEPPELQDNADEDELNAADEAVLQQLEHLGLTDEGDYYEEEEEDQRRQEELEQRGILARAHFLPSGKASHRTRQEDPAWRGAE